MQQKALALALQKGGLTAQQLDYLFAGDLLNQCVSSSYAAREQKIPFFGLYGACSTFGEGLILASMALDGGFGERAGGGGLLPLLHGGAPVPHPPGVRLPAHPHRPVDGDGGGGGHSPTGGRRSLHHPCHAGKNRGQGVSPTPTIWGRLWPQLPMTPCAPTFRTPAGGRISTTASSPATWGELGGELLCELFRRDGVDLSPSYTDCGRLIFDSRRQDVHCGGSGCGCSASVFTGYLLRELRTGRIKHLLFCPTGALHSPTTAFQGESIPGICHAVAVSARRDG